MKWKNNKVVENKGINFVGKIVNESNSIFNKIDGSNDVGLDGYIEFVENENVTGLCIGVQIKSGDSNLGKDEEDIYLKTDKEHFEYWQSHILPIIGIVYIPKEEKGFWIDITQYLNENKTIIEDGSYNIKLSRKNELSLTSFKQLHNHLKKYINEYSQYWNFGKSLSLFIDEHDFDDRIQAIKSLFYHHRNKKETWNYLIRQFGIEEDKTIQRNLIHIFMHLEGHGDTYWHKGNIIDENIRKYGKALLKKYFGEKEFEILLNNIDEGGIARGTIGQDIHALISIVPDKIELLKKIILNNKTTDQSRSYAGLLLINEFQRYDLERAKNFAQSMMNNFPKSKYYDQFKAAKEVLDDSEYIYLY